MMPASAHVPMNELRTTWIDNRRVSDSPPSVTPTSAAAVPMSSRVGARRMTPVAPPPEELVVVTVA